MTTSKNIQNILLFCYRVSFAEILGTKYAKGNVVVCAVCDEEPVFGQIKEILVTPSGKSLFIIDLLEVIAFTGHYNAYEVKCLNNETIISEQEYFADHHILYLCKSFDVNLCNTSFVCLKYHVL